MSDAVGLTQPAPSWESPPVIPLDEARWQKWKKKGRAQDRKRRRTGTNAFKWASIAALLASGVLWPQLAPDEILIRSLLAVGAVGMVFEAFRNRRYGFGAVFAGLALMYNPVAPVFRFSGEWQRIVVLATAIPFAASLTWRDPKEASID